MLIPVLATLIVIAYVASLWWLLRAERANVLLGLLVVCAVALTLRLVYTTDFPAGFDEDEPKNLASSIHLAQIGAPFAVADNGVPALLSVLFEAPLVPFVGPTRWAIRTYSLVLSVLALPLAFAVGRALRLRATSSLAIAAFLAVLPWAVFYGRISVGGEIVFHEMLLLAALTRLMGADGGWPEVGIGTLGLTLLFYDYAPVRVAGGLPLLAALLATGRRQRLQCACILLLALLAFIPYTRNHPVPVDVQFGFSAARYHPDFLRQPLHTAWVRALHVFRTLVAPVGMDGWFTIRSAGTHPWLVLGMAVLGTCTGMRRGLFLWCGFLGTLYPAVVSDGLSPSAHRMITAFPFIALAAGCGLDCIPWRRPRVALTWLVVAIAAVQSVRLYFSPAFWPTESRARFDWERTAVLEALPAPPHPRLVVMPHMGYFFAPVAQVDPNYEFLSVDNWFPPDRDPRTYVFAPMAGPLRPFYENLVGFDHVDGFGRAFLVRFERADWSWLRQHGWTYEARCGRQVQRAPVPVLFNPNLGFRDMYCSAPLTHVWWGHWLGPRASMRVRFSGTVMVDTPGGRLVDKSGFEQTADFTLEADTDVTITALPGESFWYPWTVLYEVTPAGQHIPYWDRVNPREPDPSPTPGAESLHRG